MMPLRWRWRLAVVGGGALGGAARLGVSAAFDAALPWGTLLANLGGALLLGYVLTWARRAARPASLVFPLLCTGMLGSFTTFSALSWQTLHLIDEGQAMLAAAYALGSVVLGLVAAAAGIRLARRWR
jgi:fluoride exporter